MAPINQASKLSLVVPVLPARGTFKSFIPPKEIFFAAVNYNTGKKENFNNSDSIIEAFKLSDIEKMRNNNLDKDSNYDSLIKFRQFY